MPHYLEIILIALNITVASSYCLCDMEVSYPRALFWVSCDVYRIIHDFLGNRVNEYGLNARTTEPGTSGGTQKLCHTNYSLPLSFKRLLAMGTNAHVCLTDLRDTKHQQRNSNRDIGSRRPRIMVDEMLEGI